MKSKTDFKQMYLVDAAAYNGISRTETPIILGRSNNKVSPPTINVLAPVTSRVETGNPIHTELKSNMKSIGTQSNVLNTKSTGVVTDSPPNKEHYDQTSQTPILSDNVHKFQTRYRTPRNNNRLPRDDDRSLRDNDRSERDSDRSQQNNNRSEHLHPTSSMGNPIKQIENDNQIIKEEIPSNTHLQYIVPDPEFQKAMDFTPTQHSMMLTQPQTHSQLMNTIQHSTPLALPQPQLMNTIQHSGTLALPQPQPMDTIQHSAPLVLPQPQLANTIQHSAPLALPQPQPMDTTQHSAPLALPEPMEYSMNPQINHLPPPQLMDHSTNTQTPQLDYSVNPQNSALALPAPVEDDCTECAVTKYKRYDVDLPSAQRLPEHSVFICTLCENNFSTKKSLQRHMKNIHSAFNQVEKGMKRKLKEDKMVSKKIKTSQELVPYLMYENPT